MNTMEYVSTDDKIEFGPLVLFFELVQQIVSMDLSSFLLAHFDLVFGYHYFFVILEKTFHQIES